MTTVGTHNLHDETGTPTFFATILIFTESIPETIRARMPDRYEMRVCKQQTDLVVAWDADEWEYVRSRYWPVHGGVEKVTPHRGIFVVFLRNRRTGRIAVVLAEHRINAAFPPFIRGEPIFRSAMWDKHTDLAIRLARRYKALEHVLVVAGGDLNTPYGVDGYRGVLHEVGHHFDRLASDRRLGDVTYMARKGSDHPRLRAALR